MPQIVVCKSCGHTIYQGVELKSAEEVIQMVGGQCPKCGRKLAFSIEDVEIRTS
ncbi:MAG: hypothetical protein ACXQTQ_04310 [Candidatus Hecatellaceae archaeon]